LEVLGVDLENRRMSEENEVLLENLEGHVRPEVSQQTYSPEPGRTVQSVTRNFIFTSRPITLFFLILELF
jgi:hypothetical protein